MVATVGSPAPDRTCEGCENTFPAQTDGWYVDPEGCELCPSCATELHEAWQALSPEDRVAYGLRS